MTQGFGYFDGNNYVFEGFSIRLFGTYGAFEIIPVGLVYPELADGPGSIVGVKVMLSGGTFRGEQIFDFPYATMLRLHADLDAWDREGDKGFTFPSPESVVFLAPFVVECTVEHPPWSNREWQVHCRLANGESADDPNAGRAAALEVHFTLNVSSVDSARRELSEFLRYVSSIGKPATSG